jgi:hypothetical protein
MKLQSLEPNKGQFPQTHQYAKFRVMLVGANRTKTVYFGDNRYEDYTMHHDPARKQRYLNRHRAREDFSNPETAGFWSANLLWNKPTIVGSLRDIFKQFPYLKSK